VHRGFASELDVFDDDIADLIKRHTEKVVEPSEAVQKRAGSPSPKLRAGDSR